MNETYDEIVRTVFERVRKRLDDTWPVEKDGSGPPERLVMKDAIKRLHPQISIVCLRVDKTRHPEYRDDLRCVLIYDFSKPGPTQVKFLGEADENDATMLKQVLAEQWSPQVAEHYFRDLGADARISGIMETEGVKKILQSVPYDLKQHIGEFEFDMCGRLMDWLQATVETPDPLAEYAKRYDLLSIEAPSDEALKDPDPRMQNFIRWRENRAYRLTLENLAEDVSKVFLIPPVPEEVRTTFQQAKDLHIYGYFRYDFFTLAILFAYMALEAAIRHRWCKSLKPPIILELPESKKKPRKSLTLDGADYRSMGQWCFRNNRYPHDLLVNGKPFPDSVRDLLDHLVEEGSMTLWERKQCESAWQIRNTLAHPGVPGTPVHIAAILCHCCFAGYSSRYKRPF